MTFGSGGVLLAAVAATMNSTSLAIGNDLSAAPALPSSSGLLRTCDGCPGAPRSLNTVEPFCVRSGGQAFYTWADGHADRVVGCCGSQGPCCGCRRVVSLQRWWSRNSSGFCPQSRITTTLEMPWKRSSAVVSPAILIGLGLTPSCCVPRNPDRCVAGRYQYLFRGRR